MYLYSIYEKYIVRWDGASIFISTISSSFWAFWFTRLLSADDALDTTSIFDVDDDDDVPKVTSENWDNDEDDDDDDDDANDDTDDDDDGSEEGLFQYDAISSSSICSVIAGASFCFCFFFLFFLLFFFFFETFWFTTLLSVGVNDIDVPETTIGHWDDDDDDNGNGDGSEETAKHVDEDDDSDGSEESGKTVDDNDDDDDDDNDNAADGDGLLQYATISLSNCSIVTFACCFCFFLFFCFRLWFLRIAACDTFFSSANHGSFIGLNKLNLYDWYPVRAFFLRLCFSLEAFLFLF